MDTNTALQQHTLTVTTDVPSFAAYIDARRSSLQAQIAGITAEILRLNDTRVPLDAELSALMAAQTAYTQAAVPTKPSTVEIQELLKDSGVTLALDAAAESTPRPAFEIQPEGPNTTHFGGYTDPLLRLLRAKPISGLTATELATALTASMGRTVTARKIGGVLGSLVHRHQITHTGDRYYPPAASVPIVPKVPAGITGDQKRAVYQAIAAHPGMTARSYISVASDFYGKPIAIGSLTAQMTMLRKDGYLVSADGLWRPATKAARSGNGAHAAA